MKSVGIIAEYNPFHNGHQYQIETVRKETGADYVVIAMSGDFVQRGTPAIIDKYTRTRAALLSGADLVFELPVTGSCASAELFARSGVELFGKCNVIDTICYGCENYSPALLQELVEKLSFKRDLIDSVIQKEIKNGMTYPAARCEALCSVMKEPDSENIRTFLHSPNNILALEYEKAIADWNQNASCPLSGHAILRTGNGYHDPSLEQSFISATAIRNALSGNAGHAATDTAMLAGKLPEYMLSSLLHAKDKRLLMHEDLLSAVLYTRLWELQKKGYSDFADCSSSLSHKIQKELIHFTGFCQFAGLLKSKDLTYTRICRVFLHIILGITKKDYEKIHQFSGISYLRILGFRKSAQPLLSAIKKEASLPLVTKIADASSLLTQEEWNALQRTLSAADLYRGTASIQSQLVLPNEYNSPICVL